MNLGGIINALGGISGIEADCVQLASAFGNNGLQDMVAKLQASGLDSTVQSWVDNGANLPISSEQLHNALGSDAVGQLAGALKIDPSQVAAVLPHIVDHMTPDGAVPQTHVGGLLDQLGGAGALNNLIAGLVNKPA